MELILKNKFLSAQVDTIGGELTSLKDANGKEYIWQGDPNYWSGRNPNLFPIVGSLRNDTICFDGVPYHMSRHGFARRSEFKALEHGENFVVFGLQESETTLQQFPYPFTLSIRHELTENGFYTQFEVYNPGHSPLPFCLGGHTAFNCPLKADEKFSDYRLVFDQMETSSALIPGSGGLLSQTRKEPWLSETNFLKLDHSIFDRVDTLIFEGLRSSGVKLLGPDGSGVHMDFTGFPMVAFWTTPGKNAPYICLEPWHGCSAFDNESGDFLDKRHRILLSPGESKTLRYTISII